MAFISIPRTFAISLIATAAVASFIQPATAADPPELAYQIREGRNLNAFLRAGPVAAHLIARDGNDPRLVVAFPAGNSGIAAWFDRLAAPITWALTSAPRALIAKDAKERPLYGMVAALSARAPRLHFKQVILSNVRIIRDYEYQVAPPVAVTVAPIAHGNTLRWARDRMDGAPGYALTITVTHGHVDGGDIIADADGRIDIEVAALCGDKPLTPAAGDQLLKASAAADPATRNALTFLSYKEKFLAGSWRFNTYFGRDTLMSLRLLMPVLKPQAIETGLSSVLERLSPQGEAAHEEGLSEFALIDHQKHGEQINDIPTLDYAMVDTSFMLAPVVTAYLTETKAGKARARAFLAQSLTVLNPQTPKGRIGDLLMRNLRFIAIQTRKFSANPVTANLIALKAGHDAGQWRDSSTGIGGGRYPYDVNAVFAPAALRAIGTLCSMGLLRPYLTSEDTELCAAASSSARIWAEKGAALFETHVLSADAKAAIKAYAKQINVGSGAAESSIGALPVVFHAVSLDTAGQKVAVLNSDEGFALLFDRPSATTLDQLLIALIRPFPAGLMTGAGMLIANPVYAPAAMQSKFASTAYHGTVIWSWQQALMAAGLARQLERTDLPAATRQRLMKAQHVVWTGIDATRGFSNSELWTWQYDNARFKPIAFGAQNADADESNAAQLWSTVYLAVKHPH